MTMRFSRQPNVTRMRHSHYNVGAGAGPPTRVINGFVNCRRFRGLFHRRVRFGEAIMKGLSYLSLVASLALSSALILSGCETTPDKQIQSASPPPTAGSPQQPNTNTPSLAEEVDPSIATCLKAWGRHPFGKSPKYTTLATSVSVFGIGQRPADTMRTDSPSLVLVNPGVNVMGGTTLKLLNPNAWYCFRSNVNVMGVLNIRAHCKAHLASAFNGATVLGSNSDNNSVTVLGLTHVELVGCEQ